MSEVNIFPSQDIHDEIGPLPVRDSLKTRTHLALKSLELIQRVYYSIQRPNLVHHHFNCEDTAPVIQ